MPTKGMANSEILGPYWQTRDGETVRIYHGDSLRVLSGLPSASVHTAVTSPPYWGLRDYRTGTWEGGSSDCDHRESSESRTANSVASSTMQGGKGPVHRSHAYKSVCARCGARRVDQQLGTEDTPEEYVDNLVAIFRELRRVLRDDGTLWLNLGDSYLSDGNLAGVPWRVALALQADNWILRQEVIWCLSGGTRVYARTQNGDGPSTVKDLARLNPATVQLWNGRRWTQLLGMSKNKRTGAELEIVLRSGERIACTPTHKFPTLEGVKQAGDLRVGDFLTECTIPQPDGPLAPEHVGNDAAWLAGLYLAEGNGVEGGRIHLAGHARETARWEKVSRIVADYGGICSLNIYGNNQSIVIHGKVVCSVVRDLVSGTGAEGKGISPKVWRHTNEFLEHYLDGYLGGDGHRDEANGRWRLGFTRNYRLEGDLRTACARLGWTLTLNPGFSSCGGKQFPSFRGEMRKGRSHHWNEKSRCEVVEVRKSRCREVYDLGVADEPHTFALASGVLTHNSKPDPMPESVDNRCTRAHEHLFLFAKSRDYFYDSYAIREKQAGSLKVRKIGERLPGDHHGQSERDVADSGYRNKRDVWTVSHGAGYGGNHFAVYPPELITPCILAGTSAHGCCPECGAPWRRVLEKVRVATRPGKDSKVYDGGQSSGQAGGLYAPPGQTAHSNARLAGEVTGNRDPARHVTEVRVLGWYPTCGCDGLSELKPAPPTSKGWNKVTPKAKANAPSQVRGNAGARSQGRDGDADWSPEYQNQYAEWVAGVRQECARALEVRPSEELVPAVVLDPFIGSGTTALVALEHGRNCVGIDLSEQHLQNDAIARISGDLGGRPALRHLVPGGK